MPGRSTSEASCRAAWSKNASHGELRRGRRVEPVAAAEVPDAEKPDVLRAYLKGWGWEVGRFFDGVIAASGDAEPERVADRHPVFRITPRESDGPRERNPQRPPG